MSLLHVGFDIGSTTAKTVVLDKNEEILHSRYGRHFSDIPATVENLLADICEKYGDSGITMAVTGSGALAVAEGIQIPFAQELIASNVSADRYLRGVNVCIELGGEDAKLTFFEEGGVDQRMNETCAGGTGAFLDQMATLLGTDTAGLNELAKDSRTTYPIASRCGVFAKTDIQALLNDGAAKEDIAGSIFQAIVNQTVGGLACGRKIHGNVAFLGGPLYFLPELRKRFVETLRLKPEECIFPENPHLFVAIGAAILGKKNGSVKIRELREQAARFFSSPRNGRTKILPALFINDAERKSFKARHAARQIVKKDLSDYRGSAFLGIDVGSTTTKVVLIGEAGELLFSRYGISGKDGPVLTVTRMLEELYAEMPEDVEIKNSGITGYGEKLVKTVLGVDIGEVETVAHARAAEFVLPGVGFVIDIGGQDMKCLEIENNVIKRIFLNEACSSGCGSFFQSFAESLKIGVGDFALFAEESMMPVDLGSRCTVFMNSRVRQAQKEGASVRDISAGLAYSVVRNALYKVLKIRDVDELDSHIVVQGGAFKNDALLRAFELITNREVLRPEIPELMGSFGMALLARDNAGNGRSSLIKAGSLKTFRAESETERCSGCGNRCLLTRTTFGEGKSYVTGNRCEKKDSHGKDESALPNIFDLKYRRLFENHVPLPLDKAIRGVIGIPCVLNIYEDYPFWFTLFTALGFRVERSEIDPDENLGIDTIPSQTVCYPAKLAHSHIAELLRRGIKRIFYPIVPKETNEFADAHKNDNCPVITGYPDVIWLNMDELRSDDVAFIKTPLPIDSGVEKMARRFRDAISPFFDIEAGEIKSSLSKAYAAQRAYKADVERYGNEAIRYLREKGGIGIVLAGHPYHLDPCINHGIPTLINNYGVVVLTEDSICGKASEIGGVDALQVLDQWVYHSRLYRAATVVARHPDFKNVHLVQMNSFGCGLDAISCDQVASILDRHGKPYTVIKIDEGRNNGAVKIRIRSLLAAITSRGKGPGGAISPAGNDAERRRKDSRKPCGLSRKTLLCPPLSTHHFQFLETAMKTGGINLKILPEGSRDAVELGLKYVNNDACYPAMFVVGQFLDAFESGAYDPEETACLYVQTGGACRASNYVPLLRKALDSAGYGQVHIFAANAQKNTGAEPFKVGMKAIWRSLLGLLYGDLLMRLSLATRPYEIDRGETNRLYARWTERCMKNVESGSWTTFKRDVREMVGEFSSVSIDATPRPRVGIVGEILVKYHGNANERLVETIESEGGEAVVPDLACFPLYCLTDPIYLNKMLSGKWLPSLIGQMGIALLERMRRPMKEALAETRFGKPHGIYDLLNDASTILSPANQGGEGWLLASEMIRLIESGVRNVLCVQPFACLPNHISGKGTIKELKRRYPGANILALDYDASVSTVNQTNRIKLLMATAKP